MQHSPLSTLRGDGIFRRREYSWAATLSVLLSHWWSAHAENHAGYRFEAYLEDGNRINVTTHSALFEYKPKTWLTLHGDLVYDAISGASPTGAPPPNTIVFEPDENGNPPAGADSDAVPVAPMDDARWAGSVSATFGFGPHRLTPQFSYSDESDYRSRGLAFNYSLDFNEKNTTLNVGWSHNWDEVLPNGFLRQRRNKEADDYLVGVNQLLGPKTVLTLNVAYGHARGYLNDQYKGVLFDNFPQGDPSAPSLLAEKRPQTRDKYLAYASVTHDLTKLHASIEGSYRYLFDSYSISAHTLNLTWFQKLGEHFIIAPMFRYYLQSEADFYVVRVPDIDTAPAFYSADYRLSELQTFTGGVTVTWKVREWLWLDAAYKRYVMQGLDDKTSSTAYPSANVVTVGARLWF
jgi:hypothetical protein